MSDWLIIRQVVQHHGLSSTLICVVSLARLLIPLVIHRAMKEVTFEWYVRGFLCPELGTG